MKTYSRLSVIPAILMYCYMQAHPINQPITIHQTFQNQYNNELIIVFDNFSAKQMDELNGLISQVEGISNAGYCKKYGCLLLTFDTSLYASRATAFKAVFEKISRFRPRMKEDVAHAQLKCD